MIPNSAVEEVRQRADIVAIIGELVALKRAGKDYKALCPFHEERTPSFYVVPSKDFYKCFGCGASGDVFAFVRQKLGLDFAAAVRYVAERSGVDIREREVRDRGEDPYRELYEVNAFAREFYRRQLWEGEGGDVARRYLEGRGVGREAAERFGLGFAPAEWSALRNAAAKHGLDEALLLRAGLLKESERAQEPYDRFRDRLMFPIEDGMGRVVAFGGRVIGPADEGVPKYLNSPETPIYRKGTVLYGLSWAKVAIRRESAALVVEGYMDLVSLAARGIEPVVATLGTAMTDEHARLVARYCSRALLLYDSDLAGLRATFRAGDALLAAGVHPSVVTLPAGDDPDSVVRRHGVDALRRYLAEAVDVLDRKLQILEERGAFTTIEGTRDALDRLLPTIRCTKDAALRDIYAARVAERTGVRRETIEAELLRGVAAGSRGGGRPAAAPRGRIGPLPRLGPERKLLLLLVKARDWIDRAVERLHPEQFGDPALREIFEALVADPELKHPPPGMSPGAATRFEELTGDPEILAQADRIFDDSVRKILVRDIDARIADVDRRLAEAAESEHSRLVLEKQDLARAHRELDEDWRPTARRYAQTGLPRLQP
ncbi:MAG: DNA primase [Gemmatimonadetes bacterium]|nr:DNA primase [Gemmatimonadota bacterium]